MNSTISKNTSASNDSTQRTDSNGLRSKVVEILAGTANGCLTELGYFPGLPKKLQELQQLNSQWQAENVKLYQDNRHLSQSLETQRQQLNLVIGPDSPQANTIRTLENQVRGLMDEKSNLLRQNEMLMNNQHPDIMKHQQLLARFNHLSALYGGALNEISQFRKYIQQISESGQPVAEKTVSGTTPRAPHFGFVNISQNRAIQRPQSTQRHPDRHIKQTTGPPFSQLLSGNTIVPSCQAVNYNETSTLDKNSQKTATVVSAWSNHQPYAPIALQHQHLQHSTTESHSIQGQPIAGSAINLSMRPNSAPIPQPLPQILDWSKQLPLSIDTSPLAQVVQYPHPGLPPTPKSAITTPLTPKDIHTPSSSSRPVDISLPTPPTSALGNGNFIDQQHGQDFISPLPSPPQAYSDAPARIPQRSTSRTSSKPPEPNKSSTCPSQPEHPVMASPPPSQSPTLVSIPLKRESVDMSDHPPDDHQHKKQRLEQTDSDSIVGHEAQLLVDVNVDPTDTQEIDDESDDEVVEIGPDGLRLEEDCIRALIEDDPNSEGLQTCGLCKARFEMGYITEHPATFLHATKEELIQHCSTEHHDAWYALRRDV